MGWADLLQRPYWLSIPWLGGRKIYHGNCAYRVSGRLPREFGWYLWELNGRKASWLKKAELNFEYSLDLMKFQGYLVGDRFIRVSARVDPDPEKLVAQTEPVYLAEMGLERFAFVQVALDPLRRAVYMQELFQQGVEDLAREAFIERKETIDDIQGVTPALDLAFRFATRQRQILEERQAELERKRLEEERIEQARKNLGTGLGRRVLAETDFRTAAEAALKVGGAELIDVRQGRTRQEMVVQYRFENRRLECVVERTTLRIVDSGICLEDHNTREKGDTYFTLESLPPVVRQAIREDRLVVYRHV
jgi:hypothetical protein